MEATQVLDHCAQAAGVARSLVRTFVGPWQIAESDIDAVLLAVSELVANAVEHALPPLVLHLHGNPTRQHIWVGVSDSGSAPQEGPWTSSCAADEHGRGLGIIEALSEARGTHSYPDGTTMHWALLSIAFDR
ncbi:ATP-binding protein [Streptomyces sp. NPDC090303]|uniref:ATP-binding protein n=1 Tax=Streptomyces sp. NPDC090303 TaxID=3365960 RepID=UPI00381318B3